VRWCCCNRPSCPGQGGFAQAKVCPIACPVRPSAQVRGLFWSSDDSMLVTAGMEGAVYEWRVLEGRRTRDFVQKGWSCSCVVGCVPGAVWEPEGDVLPRE
jgi:hypothetical protein